MLLSEGLPHRNGLGLVERSATAAPASRTGRNRSADSNCLHTRFQNPGTILATAYGTRLREGGGAERCVCTDTQRTTRTAEMEPNGREFAVWVMSTVRPASSYLTWCGRAPARDQQQPMTLSENSGTCLLATPSIPAAHRLGGNIDSRAEFCLRNPGTWHMAGSVLTEGWSGNCCPRTSPR